MVSAFCSTISFEDAMKCCSNPWSKSAEDIAKLCARVGVCGKGKEEE